MKTCEVFAVVFISAISYLEYSIPAPILPPEMKTRNISQTAIGVVMALFSLGNILAPYFAVAFLFRCLDRRQATQLGLVVLSAALLMYSLCYFIPTQYSLLFAVLSGVA